MGRYAAGTTQAMDPVSEFSRSEKPKVAKPRAKKPYLQPVEARGNCKYCDKPVVVRDVREGEIHGNGRYACHGKNEGQASSWVATSRMSGK